MGRAAVGNFCAATGAGVVDLSFVGVTVGIVLSSIVRFVRYSSGIVVVLWQNSDELVVLHRRAINALYELCFCVVRVFLGLGLILVLEERRVTIGVSSLIGVLMVG